VRLKKLKLAGGALARRIGPFLGVSKHARRNISRAFPELSVSMATMLLIYD
jgi:lauroyl/myristoyl acyltransferase